MACTQGWQRNTVIVPVSPHGSGGELWTLVHLNMMGEFVGSDDKGLLTALGWKRNQTTEAKEAKLSRKAKTLDAQARRLCYWQRLPSSTPTRRCA